MPDVQKPHSEPWAEVLAAHYKTGDYVPLGIWAQDNVPGLVEQLETLHYAADRLLATGLMGAVGWPSTSSEWRAEIQACVEALAVAVDSYPAEKPS